MSVAPNKIREARRTMREALKDEELRFVYVSNIAMLLYDRYGITKYETRNQAAEDILNLLFEGE